MLAPSASNNGLAQPWAQPPAESAGLSHAVFPPPAFLPSYTPAFTFPFALAALSSEVTIARLSFSLSIPNLATSIQHAPAPIYDDSALTALTGTDSGIPPANLMTFELDGETLWFIDGETLRIDKTKVPNLPEICSQCASALP